MSLYKKIESSEDLPPVGAAWESGSCDFKSDADLTRYKEMAKDIAALANATGGVLILKAAEGQSRLMRYLPMSPIEADAIRVAYIRASKDHCIPSPRIDVRTIAVDAGHVVAVNVNGYAAGPVGVLVRGHREHPNDKFGPCFMFPVRVGTDTQYLSPDRLAPLMLPELRKAAILLDSLSAEERGLLCLMWKLGPSVGSERLHVELLDVDAVGLTFDVRITANLATPVTLRIPLEAFKVMDLDHSSGQRRHRVHIDGIIRPTGNAQALQWNPHY